MRSALGLGCAKTFRNGPKPLQPGLLRVETTGTSSPDRRQKRLHADDVHHAGEIVGKHVQRHLGGDLRQPLHQEVRRTHPHLERAEGMLNRLAPAAHGLGILIQPLLHGFDNVLMLPSRDPAFFARSALLLDGAGAAGAGHVTSVPAGSYCLAISAAPTPSPSSFWSSCMSTVTFSNCPVNSNG